MIIRINRMGVFIPDPSPVLQPEPVSGDASSPEKAFGIVPTPQDTSLTESRKCLILFGLRRFYVDYMWVKS